MNTGPSHTRRRPWKVAIPASLLLHALAIVSVASIAWWMHSARMGPVQDPSQDDVLQVRLEALPPARQMETPPPPVLDRPPQADAAPLPPPAPKPPIHRPQDSPAPSAITRRPDGKPRILQAPRPPYPRLDHQRGREGTLVFRISVNAQGLPEQIETLNSSGTRRMESAARRQIQSRWKFQPTGEPYTVRASVQFRLKG